MTDQKAPENISGFWTGVYDYPKAYKEPVPFNAIMSEDAGALSGEIIEPNTFCETPDFEVFASISGAREGNSIHFTKTYEKVPRGGHTLIYEGTLDATHTKIEGSWRTMRAGSAWSGPFVMNRSAGKNTEIAEKIKSELDLVK